jgi:hypothetical protein
MGSLVVRFVFELQLSGPHAEAVIQIVGVIIAALITASAAIRAARIQASHRQPELPPPAPKRGRGRRRSVRNARSP